MTLESTRRFGPRRPSVDDDRGSRAAHEASWRVDLRLLREIVCLILVVHSMGSAEAQDQSAALRFAHLSADAPQVDVLIDGRAVLLDVEFGEVTSFLTFPAGRHQVTIFPHRLPDRQQVPPANSGSDASEPDSGVSEPASTDALPEDRPRVLEPIVRFVTLSAGGYHTMVLTGFYEPPAKEGQLGSLSIDTDPEAVELGVSGPRGYAAELAGDQLVTELQPGTYTITAAEEGYQTATYEAEVTPRSTTIVTITLQEGDDSEGDDPDRAEGIQQSAATSAWRTLELQIFQAELGMVPPPGTARVRVVHASPTSPPLRVVALSSGGGAASEVARVDSAPSADAESGDAESDDEAWDHADAAGARANESTPSPAPRSEPATGGSESEPTSLEIASLEYPNAGSYLTLPAGSYTMRFAVQRTDQTVLELTGVEFVPGAVYTFYLTSDPIAARARVIPVVDAMVRREMLAP